MWKRNLLGSYMNAGIYFLLDSNDAAKTITVISNASARHFVRTVVTGPQP